MDFFLFFFARTEKCASLYYASTSVHTAHTAIRIVLKHLIFVFLTFFSFWALDDGAAVRHGRRRIIISAVFRFLLSIFACGSATKSTEENSCTLRLSFSMILRNAKVFIPFNDDNDKYLRLIFAAHGLPAVAPANFNAICYQFT